MTARIAGQLALVTGASAGIGEACARRLARDGANLELWARRADRLERLASQIEAECGARVATAAVDVRDCDAVQARSERLIEEAGPPGILVNNAGLAAGLAPVHEGRLDDWNRMIDTNIKGLLFVTRSLLPAMIRRGSGHVVNIGSVAGRQVYPGGGVYCASKYAVQALTEAAIVDTLGSGVRVSGVNPGLVETEFSLVRFDGDEERARTVYQDVDALQPEDVADVVSFVVNAPPHVNLADVLVLSHHQASVHHILRESSDD